MNNWEKGKSIIKDIAILISILGPLLFIIVGGIIWTDDGFDGTIMEQLFPAFFGGFLAAFGIVLILSNIFKNSITVWIIGAIIAFIATVVCCLLELTSVLTIGAIILAATICVMIVIKWISSL